MLSTRLLIAASIAALLGAAPLIAQDTQQPGMNGQQTQSDQYLKKKKNMNQQQGQATGNQPQMQNQAAGEQGQPTKKLKKSQQATGQQPTTEGKQATGEQAQPTKKKKLQQNTQTEQMKGQQQATEQGQPAKKLKKQPATGQTTTGGQPGQTNQQMTTGATGKIATEIPVEKRTVVREKLISTKVQRVERSKININLTVGVRVPRTIKFYPVPVEVVALIPAYRGYLYFVMDDGTIVIVSPSTYEIVYVLTA